MEQTYPSRCFQCEGPLVRAMRTTYRVTSDEYESKHENEFRVREILQGLGDGVCMKCHIRYSTSTNAWQFVHADDPQWQRARDKQDYTYSKTVTKGDFIPFRFWFAPVKK